MFGTRSDRNAVLRVQLFFLAYADDVDDMARFLANEEQDMAQGRERYPEEQQIDLGEHGPEEDRLL
jgi:hypothetical protein